MREVLANMLIWIGDNIEDMGKYIGNWGERLYPYSPCKVTLDQLTFHTPIPLKDADRVTYRIK